MVELTVHEGWDGSLIVSVGKENQFFVDKLREGHMVNPLTIQEGLGEDRMRHRYFRTKLMKAVSGIRNTITSSRHTVRERLATHNKGLLTHG